MTILALSMSSCYLMSEKSDLEYQEMEAVNGYNAATEDLGQLGNDAPAGDLRNAQSEQQKYDSKKTTIESRLKVINAEIEGFQEAVKNNVKSECKLSLSV